MCSTWMPVYSSPLRRGAVSAKFLSRRIPPENHRKPGGRVNEHQTEVRIFDLVDPADRGVRERAGYVARQQCSGQKTDDAAAVSDMRPRLSAERRSVAGQFDNLRHRCYRMHDPMALAHSKRARDHLKRPGTDR